MEDWRIYTAVIAVVAALVGIYFRESLRQAHIQKNASNRLLAYLNYWNHMILDWDVFSIVYVGQQWREEKVKAYRSSKTAEAIIAIDEEYENKLKELRDLIKNRDPSMKFDSEDINRKFNRFTPKVMEEFLSAQRTYKQNVIEGNTFITDEEAASLGAVVSNMAINIKLRLVSLIELGTMLIVNISEGKKPIELSDHAEDIYQCIRVAIIMYQDFEPIRKLAKSVNEKSIFRLAIHNMLGRL